VDDDILAALRRRWPRWENGPKPYLRFEEVADLLGAASWQSVKDELYRLERAGKLRCVHSGGLNQVWPLFLLDERGPDAAAATDAGGVRSDARELYAALRRLADGMHSGDRADARGALDQATALLVRLGPEYEPERFR